MPLTIVVIDDSEEYRLIVRGLLRSVHDVTTFVGDAANGAARTLPAIAARNARRSITRSPGRLAGGATAGSSTRAPWRS
jgi:CheY-like chemotaxis protein